MEEALLLIFTFAFGIVIGFLISPRIIITILNNSMHKSPDKTINIFRRYFKENGIDLNVDNNNDSTFITLKHIRENKVNEAKKSQN